MCTSLAGLAAPSRCPGRLSWCWAALLCPGAGLCFLGHFPGFQATFGYTWPVHGSVRPLWDRTGASSPCPQGLDGYLDPTENVPMATTAPCESQPQQWHSPQELPEPLKHLLFLGAELNMACEDSSPVPGLSEALLSLYSCLCGVGPPSFTDHYTHTHTHAGMETGLPLGSWKPPPTLLLCYQ